MANGTRTGKQTALFVISIITIIFSVLTIIVGGLAMMGGAMIGSGAASTEAVVEGATNAEVGLVAGFAGVLLLLVGIFNLVMGIFGILGSNDATKVTPFLVCAVICLVFSVISLFSGFNLNSVLTLIVDAICVWLGYSIRQEAAL